VILSAGTSTNTDMESKDYLGYIAYFWKNLAQLVPKDDFIAFLSSHLGGKGGVPTFNAPLPKVRETARLLYKGYVVSVYTKFNAFHIVSTLDSSAIDTYLKDLIALNKKYKIHYDTVDYDLSPAAMDINIKRSSLANFKAVFSEMIDEKVSSRTGTTKAPARVRAKKSSPTTKRVPSTTPGPQSRVPAKKSPAKKTRAKVSPAKRPAKIGVKKTAAITINSCVDYTVPELKAMASMLRIPGASKMKKAALCVALGI
jgi:hypothetical protein